jgi:hypothetical protein
VSTDTGQWRVWCPAHGGARANADVILAPDSQIAVGRWAHLASTFPFTELPDDDKPLEIFVVPAHARNAHDPEVWVAKPVTTVSYNIERDR